MKRGEAGVRLMADASEPAVMPVKPDWISGWEAINSPAVYRLTVLMVNQPSSMVRKAIPNGE